MEKSSFRILVNFVGDTWKKTMTEFGNTFTLRLNLLALVNYISKHELTMLSCICKYHLSVINKDKSIL